MQVQGCCFGALAEDLSSEMLSSRARIMKRLTSTCSVSPVMPSVTNVVNANYKEQVMYQKSLFAILFTSTLLLANAVQAGGRGRAAEPWIDATQIDAQRSVLTIQGHSFGSATPAVFLGKQPLKVRQSSDREIVADLPDSLSMTSYRLVVVTGSPTRVSSAPFFTTILADSN
jgi:hypothetical protein